MIEWSTSLQITQEETQLKTNKIRIQRGIFQGDSLSAFWFCLALHPISNTVKNTKYGVNVKGSRNQCRINHLFYMDDLKLYAANRKQLDSILELTNNMTQDIGMSFGLDKCKIVTVEKGQLMDRLDFELEGGDFIERIGIGHYKYLEIIQTHKNEQLK